MQWRNAAFQQPRDSSGSFATSQLTRLHSQATQSGNYDTMFYPAFCLKGGGVVHSHRWHFQHPPAHIWIVNIKKVLHNAPMLSLHWLTTATIQQRTHPSCLSERQLHCCYDGMISFLTANSKLNAMHHRHKHIVVWKKMRTTGWGHLRFKNRADVKRENFCEWNQNLATIPASGPQNFVLIDDTAS